VTINVRSNQPEVNGERFGDTMRLSTSKGILDPAAAHARQPKEIV
jgi:hypothetical protein